MYRMRFNATIAACVSSMLAAATLLAQIAEPSPPQQNHADSLGVAELQRNRTVPNDSRLDPRNFGATGNGIADDWPAFQQAIDAAATLPDGGTVVIPSPPTEGSWRISQALRMRSRVTVRVLDPATRIRCTGDPGDGIDASGGRANPLAGWPTYGCVLFGSYTPANIMQLSAADVMAPVAGSNSVTLASSVNGNDYRRGDIVVIASKSNFRIGKGPAAYFVPEWLQLDVVEDTDARTGRIRLREPIKRSLPAAEIRKLTNNGLSVLVEGVDTMVPMWATYGAALLGGTWEVPRGSTHPFAAAGGAYGCQIAPDTVIAYTGVGYGNLLARCKISARHETISGTPLELAYGSHDNIISLGEVNIEQPPPGVHPAPWVLGFDEGAHDNTLAVANIRLDNFSGDILRIDRAAGNRVRVAAIQGGGIPGFVVRVTSSNYAGTPPETTGNKIEIGTSELASQNGYVTIQGRSSNDNHVTAGKFVGAIAHIPPLPFSVIDAGPNNTIPLASSSGHSKRQDVLR
jgi:hypothetical protein